VIVWGLIITTATLLGVTFIALQAISRRDKAERDRDQAVHEYDDYRARMRTSIGILQQENRQMRQRLMEFEDPPKPTRSLLNYLPPEDQ
jgi:hypothetical protein